MPGIHPINGSPAFPKGKNSAYSIFDSVPNPAHSVSLETIPEGFYLQDG
jgi:hypothetical protein